MPTGSIDEMVAKLAARLQQQPDDLEGWVMLARTYSILKRYSEAEVAYENVLRLGGENAGLLTDYADTMAMANGGKFTDQVGWETMFLKGFADNRQDFLIRKTSDRILYQLFILRQQAPHVEKIHGIDGRHYFLRL